MNPIIGIISKNSQLWNYLIPEMRALASDGVLLIEDRKAHPNERLSDYSYLVFPFAKLYEGFLKQLFLDLHIIEKQDYTSDHFRIGKVLSPNLAERLGKHSAWRQLQKRYGTALADQCWDTWKQARNLVFHYFPHNVRALTQKEAEALVSSVIDTMEEAVAQTRAN